MFTGEMTQLVASSLRLASRYLIEEPNMILGRFDALRRRPVPDAFPWPQPSPRFPGRDADTVLNFSEDERREFAVHVLSRYARQICTGWMDSARETNEREGLDEVTDAEFARLFDDSIFSRYLDPEFPPEISKDGRFTSMIKRRGRAFFTVDFSPIQGLKPLDGVFTAPTLTLFSRPKGGRGLRAEAIRINDLLLTPAHGGAWELAKYFVLQGAATTLVLLSHPRVHFPMDSINAITKSLLPAGHPIREFLLPHTWLTLPLNRRVQWSPHTIVANDQRLSYTPFASTGESNFAFKMVSVAGIDGSRAYPRYRFPMKPPTVHSALGPFWRSYYEPILAFATQVSRHVPKQDKKSRAWADAIAKHVAGFPNGSALFDGDTLARAMAYYVFDVSVMHATEHYDYSRMPIRQVPLRLRVPAPTKPDRTPIDRKKLVEPMDVFRHSMARKMFFSPSNLSLLKDVTYSFQEEELGKDADGFREALREVDRKPGRQFIPLDEISASIQY